MLPVLDRLESGANPSERVRMTVKRIVSLAPLVNWTGCYDVDVTVEFSDGQQATVRASKFMSAAEIAGLRFVYPKIMDRAQAIKPPAPAKPSIMDLLK
jgi:hypothetical protein